MKKLLCMMVSLILLLTFSSNGVLGAENKSTTMGFSDVKGSEWFGDDLNYIISDSRKILAGYPDGTFRPSGTLQVDQFIKCMVVASGEGANLKASSSSYWAQTYIDLAIELGYIQSDDYKNYKRAITRQEMADMVVNVLENMETTDYKLQVDIENSLKDLTEIGSQYQSDVTKVYELGIITGYPDGTFKPENTLIRAEATAVIRRVIDKSVRKPFVKAGETVSQEDPYKEYYKGGSLWKDPVLISEEENEAVDKSLTDSEKIFVTGLNGGNFDDYVGVIIKFGKEEYPTDQHEDFKRILLRRLSNESVEILISYINTKTGWYEFLQETEKRFILEEYTIDIVDVVELEGTEFKQSNRIEIQVWK